MQAFRVRRCLREPCLCPRVFLVEQLQRKPLYAIPDNSSGFLGLVSRAATLASEQPAALVFSFRQAG